jgi:hypothetical protein
VQYSVLQRIKQKGDQEGNKGTYLKPRQNRIQISNTYKNVQSLFRQRQQESILFCFHANLSHAGIGAE